jgi:hypothetical protein
VSRRHDRTADIAMDEVKASFSPEVRLLGEGHATMQSSASGPHARALEARTPSCDETCAAVRRRRWGEHHHHLGHVLSSSWICAAVRRRRCAEPSWPCVVIMSSSEPDGARDVEVQHVQTIGAAPYIDEQLLLPIPNAKHAVVDVDHGVVLIQLAKAHDAITELRDVVHTGEDLVPATLASEGDGATALDSHH